MLLFVETMVNAICIELQSNLESEWIQQILLFQVNV